MAKADVDALARAKKAREKKNLALAGRLFAPLLEKYPLDFEVIISFSDYLKDRDGSRAAATFLETKTGALLAIVNKTTGPTSGS